MFNQSFRYSALNVDLVQLEPGESFRFRQAAGSGSYGIFALGGPRTGENVTEIIDDSQHTVTELTAGPVAGRKFNYVGHWVPNDVDTGWSNDAVGHDEMTITAGEQGARWICLSKNRSGTREISHVVVDGSTTLPAGWGFVVARGEFECEGKIAGQLAYFRPRDVDVEVVGSGDLLLVR